MQINSELNLPPLNTGNFRKNHERSLNIYSVILLLILPSLGAIIFLIALGSLPFNPVSLSYAKRTMVYTFIPEGWGFFTRDPKETRTLMYKNVKGEWVLFNGSNANFANIFGLKRNSRRKALELVQILSDIKQEEWIQCSGESQGCVPGKLVQIKNAFNKPIIKEQILLISQEPIPWAWAKSKDAVKSSKAVLVNVE